MITTKSLGIGQDWQKKFCLRDHSEKWLDRACAFFALQCGVSKDIIEAGGEVEAICTLMSFDEDNKSKPPELSTVSLASRDTEDKDRAALLLKSAVDRESPHFSFMACEAWSAKVNDPEAIPSTPIKDLPDREEVCVLQMVCRIYGATTAIMAVSPITRGENVLVEPFSEKNVHIHQPSEEEIHMDRYSMC